MFSRYNHFMNKYPIFTQSITAGMLCSLGDIVAQQGLEKVETHNLSRTSRFFIFGSVFVGPIISQWYKFLNKHINTPSMIKNLVTRVALDQLIFAPNSIILFFFVTGTLEGNSFKQTYDKLEKEYWNVLKANWTLWPTVQILNFQFIPLHYQSVLVNSISVGWNAYLSRANQRSSLD